MKWVVRIMAISLLFMLLLLGGIVIVTLMGGGLAMTKSLNLRSLYLYLVCLITLVIFIFGTIFTINRTVDLAIGGGYYYQTLEEFQERYYIYKDNGESKELKLSKEEIEENYEKYLTQEAERRRIQNIRELSNSIAAMLVGGGFWFYHWKKIKED